MTTVSHHIILMFVAAYLGKCAMSLFHSDYALYLQLACGNMSLRTANMLSFPFFAIKSCGFSEASVTAMAKVIENSLAFRMRAVPSLLTIFS